jgi:lytic murein transglycosylase
MDRRIFLAMTFAACAGAAPTPADLLGASGEPYFLDWLNDFYARALAKGVARSVLDRELSGLSPDPRVAGRDANQPETAKPVSDYIAGNLTAGRIAMGRAKRAQVAGLAGIEQKFGVPGDVLIAVWAMESGFGAFQGDFDEVRSLATLAAAGRRRAWAETELLAALQILASGEVPRARLKGSWAGAMGQTQFVPTAFLASAIDFEGTGKRDIWTSAPDALASAANLLAKSGWRRSEGWAYEVVAPSGFDFSLSEGPLQPASWWLGKGLKRVETDPWRPSDLAAPATLLVPTGAGGPAFLALANHFVIRTYNNSVPYALSVGLLADRFAGAGPLHTPWPHETPLSLTDRLDAQTALAKLGFDPHGADGRVGAGTRQALRAWQKSQGLIADGYLSPEMVQRLRAAVARS